MNPIPTMPMRTISNKSFQDMSLQDSIISMISDALGCFASILGYSLRYSLRLWPSWIRRSQHDFAAFDKAGQAPSSHVA